MRDNCGRTDTLRDSLKLLIMRLKAHMPHVGDCCEALNISAMNNTFRQNWENKKNTQNFVFCRFMSFVFMSVVNHSAIAPRQWLARDTEREIDGITNRWTYMYSLSQLHREASLQILRLILTRTKDSIFVLKRYQRRLKIIWFIIIFRGACVIHLWMWGLVVCVLWWTAFLPGGVFLPVAIHHAVAFGNNCGNWSILSLQHVYHLQAFDLVGNQSQFLEKFTLTEACRREAIPQFSAA